MQMDNWFDYLSLQWFGYGLDGYLGIYWILMLEEKTKYD